MSDNLTVTTPTKGHNKSEWGQTIGRKPRDYSLLCNERARRGRSSLICSLSRFYIRLGNYELDTLEGCARTPVKNLNRAGAELTPIVEYIWRAPTNSSASLHRVDKRSART
jgi:hypothetical protein